MQVRRILRIVREKAGILVVMAILIGAVAGCQIAGNYLYEHYLSKEVRETAGKAGSETDGGVKIVIDSGHGGQDPGKIGVNGAKEKDVNLAIAKKLQAVLEEKGIEVVMTRTDSGRLAGSQVEDLKARVDLIDSEGPLLAVSIHQNSYPQESVRGPQVFYFQHSEKAKAAAAAIQEELKLMDPDHAREMKDNTTYYMLKNTKAPVVIVECGFLSSPDDAQLLIEEEYQQTLAQTIGNGVLKYVESQ